MSGRCISVANTAFGSPFTGAPGVKGSLGRPQLVTESAVSASRAAVVYRWKSLVITVFYLSFAVCCSLTVDDT